MKNIISIKTHKKTAISNAVNLIRKGEVIALPTDTIYGLACDATNEKAMKKLYKIKGRNSKKPVAICVSDYDDFKKYGVGDHLPRNLIEKLLPGPFTIVVKKSIHLNNRYLNPGIKKIGIRIPDFDFIRAVCREFNHPIALTSANKSAEKSSLSIHEFKELWPALGAVFDCGKLSDTEEARIGSTVIDLSEPNNCQVIRKGIKFELTLKLLDEFKIKLDS